MHFLTYEDVNLSVPQAYELCLASTMELRSALIVRSGESEWICARVKAVPDRTVIIRLKFAKAVIPESPLSA